MEFQAHKSFMKRSLLSETADRVAHYCDDRDVLPLIEKSTILGIQPALLPIEDTQ